MTNSLKCPRGDLVIIPAYEPDDSLITFSNELLLAGLEVLVVNDGSSPSCADVFSKLDDAVTFLSYDKNRGKGYAMKYAMAYIQDHMPSVQRMVTADADGQHSQKDTIRTLDALSDNPDALILGVRSFPENTPVRSRIGNRFTAKLFQFLTGIDDLNDTQTGLRAFSRKNLSFMLAVDGERYEYEMKQLLLWSRAHKALVQIPIETIYRDEENSTSHYDTVKDSVRIFRSLLDRGQAILFAASGIISFIVDFGLFNIFYYALKPFSLSYPLVVPNIASRLLSSLLNFHLNRNYVFESKDSVGRDAWQYAFLVICLLIVNNLLLRFLGNTLGIHPTLSKLIVEITIFIVSYSIQRLFIFSNRHIRSKK